MKLQSCMTADVWNDLVRGYTEGRQQPALAVS